MIYFSLVNFSLGFRALKNLIFLCTLFFLFSCASKPQYYQPKNKSKVQKSNSIKTPRESSQPSTTAAPNSATQATIANQEEPAPPPETRSLPSLREAEFEPVKSIPAVAKESTPTPLELARVYVDRSVQGTAAEQVEFRNRALELLKSFSKNDLEQLSQNAEFGYLRVYSLMQLGEVSVRDRDLSLAQKCYRSVIDLAPGSEFAAQSQQALDTLNKSSRVNSKSIGIILPLSGRNKSIGERLLRSIQMGLGVDKNPESYSLTIIDSQGLPELATQAVDKLVVENEVVAILGGVLSREAQALAERAQDYGVPTITFTQKSGITDLGSSIYRHALTSELQVRELVRYAMQELDIKKFAIMYPNDAYGVEFANIFWDEVLVRGGEINAAQTYTPDEKNFNPFVKRMIGTFYEAARSEEYAARKKELEKIRKASPDRSKKSTRDKVEDEELLQPMVDFDAVFIPDTGRALSQIASFFNYNNVKDLKFIGPNIWNTPEILRRSASANAELIYVDALDPSSESFKNSKFFTEYKLAHNEEPTLLEVQAFEASSVLNYTLSKKAYNRDTLIRNLNELEDFSGVTGPLRMNSRRELIKPLKIFSVINGKAIN